MVTRYRSGWDYESLNEFTTVYVVRWRGKDGKRYASPFKTKDSADNKAKEYRSQGNKEVTVTQDTLRGNIKFKSDNSPDIKGMQKEDVGDYLRSKMNPTQIANIKKVWQGKKASDVTPAVKAMIKRLDIPTQLAIRQANVPHLSKLIEDASKDAENMAKLRTRQMALQTKLKDLDPGESKDKTPMAIAKNDIETIQMKMDQLRSKMKKEQVHPAKSLIEAITAVKNKAEKTGMPYSILKKVYDRGMAAWKGGHRPGATQVQWALARVNSFITKGSGTWGGADKDLAKQVRSEDLRAVPQDGDVKKKDGTQPKKYYKGLSKSEKGKRADYFKNNDSNKPAPGDKDAKTKPSIHTNKYKKMYGEGAKQLVDRILKEKMEKNK